MKNYVKSTASLVVAQTKASLRNWVYIFFMILLPTLFLLVFGMMYSSDGVRSWNVIIFNDSNTPAGKQISDEVIKSLIKTDSNKEGVFKKIEADNFDKAEEKMVRGEADAIIKFPQDFGKASNINHKPSGDVEVIYRKNANSTGNIVSGVVDKVFSKVNDQMGREKANFNVKPIETNKDGLRTFDYVFAGLLSYTVMTFGLLGLSNLVPENKQTGVLKRIHASPVSSAQYLFSVALSFMVVSIIAFALMFVIAINAFNFKMSGSWWNFIAFTLISLIMMFGTGLLVGGICNDEKKASGLANMVMFPMMFLSGVFIPRFLMPEIFQKVTDYIPLTPINDGIRMIITENYSLAQVAPQLCMIVVWAVILYVAAIKLFRWE